VSGCSISSLFVCGSFTDVIQVRHKEWDNIKMGLYGMKPEGLIYIHNFNGFHPVVCIHRNNIYIYIYIYIINLHSFGLDNGSWKIFNTFSASIEC
jgi:hypothetical protein